MKTTWDFIEKYYPKYDSCPVVAETLDLLKIVDGEALEENSDAWKKLAEIKSNIKAFYPSFSEEEINTAALNEVHETLDSNLVSLLNAAVSNFHVVNPEYQKEIAIVTAFFVSEIETNSSLFNIVDKAYQLAIQFVDKYPPETVWEMDTDLGYEETLCKFLREHEKN